MNEMALPVAAASGVTTWCNFLHDFPDYYEESFTFTTLPLPTLTPSASTVAPGRALSVTWNTVSGGALDWIGIFELGTGNGETQSFGWEYTHGATSGTFTLVAPGQLGDYEFRYLPDDGYTVVAQSSVVTVRQP